MADADGKLILSIPGLVNVRTGNSAVTNAVVGQGLTILTPQKWPLQRDATAFFGDPRKSNFSAQHLVSVPCPWKLFMGKTELHSIQINKACAASLTRVLNFVWEKVGKDQSAIETLHYHLYSGSYNFRPMRGGSALSMHAYGAAIDWDDQENQQHHMKHLFQDNSLLIQAFKAEGWSWGGNWSPASVDAMHVQAARVH
jgi:hypothetical protein